MKRFTKCFLVGLAGSLCLAEFNLQADLEVSASVQIQARADFYAPLTPCGTWIEVGSYGRCWRPTGVAIGWRPYCYGHWVGTDCGWYWASDEPWAWACYHYGYWVYDPQDGWLWVPGVEWAPAWVSWRFGGGYCGWAPLGPPGVVVALPSFVFVESAHFSDPVRPSTVIINNTTIINKTTLVASPKRETRSFAGAAPQKVVVNEGPGVDTIRKATGKSVEVVSVREAARQTPVPSAAMRTMNASRKDERPAAAHDVTGSPAGTSDGWKGAPQHPPGTAPAHKGYEQTGRSFGYYPHWRPGPDSAQRPPTPGNGKDGDKGGDKGGR
jgi:hypothetical protein